MKISQRGRSLHAAANLRVLYGSVVGFRFGSRNKVTELPPSQISGFGLDEDSCKNRAVGAELLVILFVPDMFAKVRLVH